MLSTCAFGQDTSLYYSNGLVNGRLWNTLSQSEKLTFVAGISEGVNLLAGFVHMKGSDLKDLNARATPDEMREMMNKLFSDPANANIPIGLMYCVAKAEASGENQDFIDRMLVSFRATTSDAPKETPAH